MKIVPPVFELSGKNKTREKWPWGGEFLQAKYSLLETIHIVQIASQALSTDKIQSNSKYLNQTGKNDQLKQVC